MNLKDLEKYCTINVNNALFMKSLKNSDCKISTKDLSYYDGIIYALTQVIARIGEIKQK